MENVLHWYLSLNLIKLQSSGSSVEFAWRRIQSDRQIHTHKNAHMHVRAHNPPARSPACLLHTQSEFLIKFLATKFNFEYILEPSSRTSTSNSMPEMPLCCFLSLFYFFGPYTVCIDVQLRARARTHTYIIFEFVVEFSNRFIVTWYGTVCVCVYSRTWLNVPSIASRAKAFNAEKCNFPFEIINRTGFILAVLVMVALSALFRHQKKSISSR